MSPAEVGNLSKGVHRFPALLRHRESSSALWCVFSRPIFGIQVVNLHTPPDHSDPRTTDRLETLRTFWSRSLTLNVF